MEYDWSNKNESDKSPASDIIFCNCVNIIFSNQKYHDWAGRANPIFQKQRKSNDHNTTPMPYYFTDLQCNSEKAKGVGNHT